MGKHDDIPSNATGPPPPDYDTTGNNDERKPPGGYLGENKPNIKKPLPYYNSDDDTNKTNDDDDDDDDDSDDDPNPYVPPWERHFPGEYPDGTPYGPFGKKDPNHINRNPDGSLWRSNYPDYDKDDPKNKKKEKKKNKEKGQQGSQVTTGPVAPDPTEPDYKADVWETIHYAAKSANNNRTEMGKQIRGGDINAHSTLTRYTPLHIAVKYNQVRGVQALLAANARVDSLDILGQTPLSLSCCYDVDLEIRKTLLQNEANTEIVDKYSWTSLFWAAKKGYYDTVNLLLDNGANKNARDKRGQRPYDVASDSRIRALLQ